MPNRAERRRMLRAVRRQLKRRGEVSNSPIAAVPVPTPKPAGMQLKRVPSGLWVPR